MKRLCTCLALLLCIAVPAFAQLPPDAAWQTFDTPHFRVHFTQGLEPAARRAAYFAEDAYRELSAGFVPAPRRRIDLVVADNVDYANGYATPFPTNRIVVYAHPPTDELSLAFFDDWLQLVVAHELVHIFQLDHVGGIWKGLRAVFGRSPLLFPQLYNNPGWVTEGLATYWESRLTEAGRVRGTYFDMVLRTAILNDAFFTIDRASGNPTTWPGGQAAYVYGSHLFARLAEQGSPEQVNAYVREVGRQLVPFQGDREARDAFGTSFSRAWGGWEDTLGVRYRALADSLRAVGLTEPEVLTKAGRYARFPRFGPGGETIAYAASTGREPPATRLIGPDGEIRTLAERNTLGPSAWAGPGGLVTAQLEVWDPYRVYADLYRVGIDGEEVRLTRGARVRQPDVHPSGDRVVTVGNAGASNTLEIVDLRTGARRPLVPPSLDTQWSLPRWSPRGDRIAVGRWRTGGFFDVVVLDTSGAVLREITRDRAVDDAPAWSPDGRYIVWASDRTGISNLYAYDFQTGETFQVTNLLTGAFEPDVSPNGRWVAFSYYQEDGFYIARIPWNPTAWRPAPPVRAAVVPRRPGLLPDTVPLVPAVGGPARPYSPLPSLAPAGWMPLVDADTTLGFGFGAAVFGRDVVGRHDYFANLLVYTERGRLEGDVAYRYQGLGNPVLDVAVSQDWAALAGSVVRQQRSALIAATAVRPRFRSFAYLRGGLELEKRDYEPAEAGGAVPPAFVDQPPDAGAFVGAGYFTTGREAFSISLEDGFSVSTTVSGHRYTRPYPGLDRTTGYLEAVGRASAYRAFHAWGFARHVLAFRLLGGVRTGERTPVFLAGGTGGEILSPLDLGSAGTSVSFPIRGYRAGVQFGDRAFLATGEYRFPLALVERGYRLLPFFVNRFWGDIYADVGGAYCASACRRPVTTSPTPLASVGAELGVDLTVGYYGAVPLRAGVAVPLRSVLDREGSMFRPRPGLYVAAGRSF